MDMIILAGGIPDEKDPLFSVCSGKPKSLMQIAGKPMVQWVLDAISGAKLVGTVVLIGIEETSQLNCSKDLISLRDEGSLIGNITQGVKELQRVHPQETHVVTISADIPAVTSEIIDTMIKTYSAYDMDICYAVVERPVMENRYPGSKRTYIKLKGSEICGADLNYVRKESALNPAGVWNELIESRKNPLKQAGIIGLDTLFFIILGMLDLESTINRVCKRLHITGKAIQSPFAEIGMDVDKPFQFEMVEKDLMR